MKAAWMRCVLSLSPLFTADPPLTLAHKPSALNHPWVPRVHPCPQGWRRSIPVLSPSQTTWAGGLQGLRETTICEPSGQAGGALEDVLPETLGDRLPGKEGRHPEPS